MKKFVLTNVTRAYLAYKNVLASKKGSPSMEYIFLIGVGALVAGALALAFKDNGAVKDAFIKKIKEVIDGVGVGGKKG